MPWPENEYSRHGDDMHAAFVVRDVASEAPSLVTEGDVRRAVERVVSDLQARSIWLSDDTVPTVMSWHQAHRLHGDAPYIGCPFCRDRFEPKR